MTEFNPSWGIGYHELSHDVVISALIETAIVLVEVALPLILATLTFRRLRYYSPVTRRLVTLGFFTLALFIISLIEAFSRKNMSPPPGTIINFSDRSASSFIYTNKQAAIEAAFLTAKMFVSLFLPTALAIMILRISKNRLPIIKKLFVFLTFAVVIFMEQLIAKYYDTTYFLIRSGD